jgi:hypothetical protein
MVLGLRFQNQDLFGRAGETHRLCLSISYSLNLPSPCRGKIMPVPAFPHERETGFSGLICARFVQEVLDGFQ